MKLGAALAQAVFGRALGVRHPRVSQRGPRLDSARAVRRSAGVSDLLRVLLFTLYAAGAGAQTALPVEEVPFITTPDSVTLEMLRIARVGPQDHVIDLGSGDGRIVITAARRFGAGGLGVEIVPELVRRSVASAQRAGVADRVEFREQDIFQTDLSAASVVTLYLLPEFNLRLRPSLLALAPGTRIVSHDWDMGDWQPDETAVVEVPDKAVGLAKSSRVHLWRVPARIDGLWCAGAMRLRFEQSFQSYRAQLNIGAAAGESWRGHIDGVSLPAPAGEPRRPALQWRNDLLTVQAATPALAAGTRFVRAVEDRCPP